MRVSITGRPMMRPVILMVAILMMLPDIQDPTHQDTLAVRMPTDRPAHLARRSTDPVVGTRTPRRVVPLRILLNLILETPDTLLLKAKHTAGENHTPQLRPIPSREGTLIPTLVPRALLGFHPLGPLLMVNLI